MILNDAIFPSVSLIYDRDLAAPKKGLKPIGLVSDDRSTKSASDDMIRTSNQYEIEFDLTLSTGLVIARSLSNQLIALYCN